MARSPGLEKLFEGRRVDREIIVRCARWYPRSNFRFRNLLKMTIERALSIAHTTTMPRLRD